MAVAVLLLSFAPAAHSYTNPHDRTPATCDGKTLVHHVHRARVLLKSAFDPDRWRNAAKRSELKAYREHKRCVLYPSERSKLSRLRAKLERRFERYRKQQQEIEALTPYGEWAIPAYIVECESHGSWSAANPSGAIGPYQLLGKGAPWPVDSEADKLAHHRIAGALWAGGAGASHWVCA